MSQSVWMEKWNWKKVLDSEGNGSSVEGNRDRKIKIDKCSGMFASVSFLF